MNSVTRRRSASPDPATAVDPPPGAETPDVSLVADRVLEAVPRVMRRIRRAMGTETAGQPATTVPQLRALIYIRRKPGCNLSALAGHLGMTPPGCSGLVERLVRAGLIERTTDPRERRRVQLRLTAAGMERAAHASLRARAWLIEGLVDLTPAQLRTVAGTLDLLEHVTAEGDRA